MVSIAAFRHLSLVTLSLVIDEKRAAQIIDLHAVNNNCNNG
jgi:hypothetical protein